MFVFDTEKNSLMLNLEINNIINLLKWFKMFLNYLEFSESRTAFAKHFEQEIETYKNQV